jgi:hypothetical protein
MEDQLQMILRRQSELEQTLLREQAARVSAQGEVEAIRASISSTANGPPGLRDDRHIGFVDTKLLGKPDKFDGKDTSWKDWRFVTRAYFLAAMPGIDLLLDLAEGTDQEIENVFLDQRTASISKQLYYVLVMLTKDRALDKVQSVGTGEGAKAWREMHLQWEPRTKTRLTGMLVQILTKKFGGDIQNGIESWERLIREFESQSEYKLPDFILCGIVLAGIEDHVMKEHIAMNSNRLDSFIKMKSEIVDIARTKAAVSRPSPMEIDAIYKGKGKSKGGKGDKAKGKGGKGKEKGKENSVPHDPNIVCYYCSGKGHRKIDCRKNG